jgi:hypothetical protein
MDVTRRGFIAGVSVAGAAMAVATPSLEAGEPRAREGRLKRSVCRWCFGSMPLDDLCREAAAMGYGSVELLDPPDFDTPRRHGMTCEVASFVKSNTIGRGFNRIEHHDSMVKDLEERLPLVKAAGIPCQIVFSGNRSGMDDREGLVNCAGGPQADHAAGGATGRDHRDGAAQQQGGSQGLHVRPARRGASSCASGWRARGSSCCTTSIACRSWKAT